MSARLLNFCTACAQLLHHNRALIFDTVHKLNFYKRALLRVNEAHVTYAQIL